MVGESWLPELLYLGRIRRNDGLLSLLTDDLLRERLQSQERGTLSGAYCGEQTGDAQ